MLIRKTLSKNLRFLRKETKSSSKKKKKEKNEATSKVTRIKEKLRETNNILFQNRLVFHEYINTLYSEESKKKKKEKNSEEKEDRGSLERTLSGAKSTSCGSRGSP